MRIIAGAWRGRPLKAPEGQSTRPTADRVRETLFSMLVSRIGNFEGLRVADLFAGSGALGLEALSRGAASATFVENDRGAAAAISANLAKLKAEDRATLLQTSALTLPRADAFDLILADPPFAPGSGTAAVQSVTRSGWLATGGWMSVEYARGDAIDAGAWEIAAERDVGRARLTLLRAL